MKRAAGDALLHPVALAAVALLVLNDHWLKHAHPGALSGKLSDFAGLAFFPLVLVGAWEVALAALGRAWLPSQRALAVAACATAAAFVAIKTSYAALDAWRWSLGALHWAWRGRLLPVAGVRDPTDLVALPALLVPLLIGSRRAATTARA